MRNVRWQSPVLNVWRPGSRLVGLGFLALGMGLIAACGSGKSVPAPKSVSFGADQGAEILSGGEEILTLQADQIRNAGIKTEEAGEGIADADGTVTGAGIVQTNAYKDVRVFAYVRGVVTTFKADLGQAVRKGEVIGVASSEEFARAQGEYVAALVAAENAKNSEARSVRVSTLNPQGRGEFESAQRAMASAEAVLEEARGRFERAKKMSELGAISREQFEAEKAKFGVADAEASEARARFARASELLSISSEARAAVETARAESARSKGALAEARQRLANLGMTDREISDLNSPDKIVGVMKLRSPISGTLISRTLAPGSVFEANTEVFRVADLTELWFVAQVPEAQLGGLLTGSDAEVFVGGSATSIRGRVAYVDPSVNETTRTGQVRVLLRNEGDRRILLGSFASLKTVGSNRDDRRVALVKSSAIQAIGGSDCVFVAKPDGVTFEVRRVRKGKEIDGLVPILEGLSKGEQVVVEGSFLIRAELVKRKIS